MEAQATPPSLGEPPNDPPPADWLEPLEDIEEDEDDGGDQGFHLDDPEKADTGGDMLKRTPRDGLRSRTPIELDDLWVDWPNLGKGWKRREVYRNSGTRSDIYYMSPDGVRMRSKVEIGNRFPNIDLRSFDYRSGLFVKKNKSKQKQVANSSGDEIVSGRTTPPESSSIPTILPQTPQQVNSDANSAPSRPSSDFGSPPHLTPISPLKQQLALSSLHDHGYVNPNTTATTPSKLVHNELIPKSWLHPSVQPVSPVKKSKKSKKKKHCKKKKHSASPAGHASVKVSPTFPSPPVTQHIMDPKMELTANMQTPGPRPVTRNCARCACMFSSEKNEELCTSCRTLKMLSIPRRNIVFKKIARGKWVLASPANLNPEKKANSMEQKKISSWKSQRLMELKSKKNCDSEDNEEKPTEGYKKRSRRMCFECVACLRIHDCGKCDNCKDKTKFGGPNTKKQKCRLRQCLKELGKGNKNYSKILYKKLHGIKEYKPGNHDDTEYKPTRPRSTRKHKRPAWEDDYIDPGEELKKSRQKGSPDRDEEEDDENDSEFELEQSYDIIDDHANGEVNTETSHSFPVVFQNGQLQIGSSFLQTSGSQGPVVLYVAPMAGGAVHLSEDVQMVSKNQGAPVEEESLQPMDIPPIMCEILSFTNDSAPLEGSGEPELMHLLGALHRTVLPAHWMAVLAKGPVLQLLQCSRRSAMANTLLQIEPGFSFRLSVAGLSLPPSHMLYERHPPRLTSVSTVVELLLDMEGLAVCQGYPWDSELAVRPHTGQAVLCGRAAGCHLLVDLEEEGEHCDKCHPPLSD